MRDTEHLRAALMEAFSIIPIHPSRIDLLGRFVEHIVDLSGKKKLINQPEASRDNTSTTKQAQKEIASVKLAVKKLQGALGDLHRPALEALDCVQFSTLGYPEIKAVPVDLFFMLSSVEMSLKLLTIAAENALPVGTKQAHRPSDKFCTGLTLILVARYERLTAISVLDSESEFPPSFLQFVTKVFLALGLTQTPRFFAKHALKDWRDQKHRTAAAAREVSRVSKYH